MVPGIIGFIGKIALTGGNKGRKIYFYFGNTLVEAEIIRWLVDYKFLKTQKLQTKTQIFKSAAKKKFKKPYFLLIFPLTKG